MYPVGQQPQYSPQSYNGQQQQQHPQQQYGVYQQPGAAYAGYGSQPTLPRYASNGSSIVGAANGNGSSPSLSSPLNPSSHNNQHSRMSQASSNNGMASGLNSRYSTYGYANGGPGAQGGAHPLSHALYADSNSSPTLAGDDIDEKKGLGSFPPSSSSSSGDDRSGQNVGRRTHNTSAAGRAYNKWSGNFIANSGTDPRHTKPERIGWLDGLRFIAAWVVLNATFFNATITDPNSYTALQRSSPVYIFRSFGLGLTFFLMILGRALTAPLWEVTASNANGSKFGASNGPSISFPRLTRAMLTRTARFVLPVMVIAALQWALGATNATKDANAAGIQQPYWNLIRSFSGYVTIIFNCFTAFEYDTPSGQAFAGNLWTNAWLFQSSFAVYIVHMMLGNLSSARYWIYGILGFFMWTTENYFCAALIGAVLSDMAAHGQFARVRKWPFMRILALQIILLAIGLAIQWVNVVRDNLNKGMATISVLGYDELTFSDLILVTCVMLVFETSGILQAVFGNVVMRLLGKLAPGMYLLAPSIVYTVVPTLAISLRNGGTNGSGIMGVTWVVTFAVCTVAAIPFHFFVELPSKLAGEYFADFVESWGARPDDVQQVKGPQAAAAPKKLAGPGPK